MIIGCSLIFQFLFFLSVSFNLSIAAGCNLFFSPVDINSVSNINVCSYCFYGVEKFSRNERQ